MGLTLTNKKNLKKEAKINQIFDGIKLHLNESINSVDQSHTFFKIGLEDDLVKYINKYSENPLTLLAHTFNGHIDSINQILLDIVQKFFISHSRNVYKIFQSNESGNYLHFYIILKEDTLIKRRPYFSFLNDYDNELISNQFPILFEFISQKKEDEIKKVKEIKLENEESVKKG